MQATGRFTYRAQPGSAQVVVTCRGRAGDSLRRCPHRSGAVNSLSRPGSGGTPCCRAPVHRSPHQGGRALTSSRGGAPAGHFHPRRCGCRQRFEQRHAPTRRRACGWRGLPPVVLRQGFAPGQREGHTHSPPPSEIGGGAHRGIQRGTGPTRRVSRYSASRPHRLYPV